MSFEGPGNVLVAPERLEYPEHFCQENFPTRSPLNYYFTFLHWYHDYGSKTEKRDLPPSGQPREPSLGGGVKSISGSCL